MDNKRLPRLIDDLRSRLALVENAIAVLARPPDLISDRRGRESMGAVDRLEVSERMKRY
jgi:hypothetical protein